MATRRRDFWTGWLTVVVAGTLLFGLAMVVLPGATRSGFNLMLYGTTASHADFGPEAARYVNLAHAVMGAVMVGWSAALLWVVRGPLRRGEAGAWAAVAVSVAAWFFPDTAASLWHGYWQNAVLNGAFAFLYAVPLTALRRS